MLDRDGFRPNVGIILLNQKSQVFWGKRIRTHSWQFPQGGIDRGENPEQAMFRELHEEVGLHPQHVHVLARTRDWLRYEVVDFKRGVYEMALLELARFVPYLEFRSGKSDRVERMDNRPDLRQQAPHDHSAGSGHFHSRSGAAFELPPGATFEPDPCTSAPAMKNLEF